ncbi:MAG: ABC transporter permease subunit, partial [Gemmobacter sp.]|nr:ABC transporter permease subunit [Gemmobacter sp.]
MTAILAPTPTRRRSLFWPGLMLITLALSQFSGDLVTATGWKWLTKLPKAWEPGFGKQISRAMKWLVEEAGIGPLSVQDITRGVAAAIEAPYRLVRAGLIDGFRTGIGQQAVELLPSAGWLTVVTCLALLGYRAGGLRLAALVGTCFLYLVLFGQWQSAMVTLASVVIAVPLGVACGVALGIAAWRMVWIERALRPMLDLMQTVPVFAYLVPILVLFGFGPVAALVATVIYAMPPMVRLTTLSLREVPPEVEEAGRMAGCTRRQLLWKVQLPTALPALMVGVNQVIMLSLNMVIIASMIGAGGLGYDVLASLRRLDIGGGVEAGFAIVVMAVALDRLSQALARRSPGKGRWRQTLAAMLAILVVAGLAGMVAPWTLRFPETWQLSTGGFWAAVIGWINVNLHDMLEAGKIALLKGLLVPVKTFFLGIPWPWGIALAALAAGRLGGRRLGLLAGSMTAFIAFSGLWPEAMMTLYLCGVSVLIAMALGVPLGLWAAASPRAGQVIGLIIDTLQTLPSFVYLIPVV